MIQNALSMTPPSHIQPHLPYRPPKPLTSHSGHEPFNLTFIAFSTSLQNISDIIPPSQAATRTDKPLREARDCGDFPGGPTASAWINTLQSLQLNNNTTMGDRHLWNYLILKSMSTVDSMVNVKIA
jgi:hypothetical protein